MVAPVQRGKSTRTEGLCHVYAIPAPAPAGGGLNY